MSDLSVPFDAFTIDPIKSPLNYARVHCRVEGQRVATFGYTTGVSSPRPPQAVYQTTSIVLHRRGRRLVRRGDTEQFEATDGAVSVFPSGTEMCPRYLEPCEGLVVGLSPALVGDVSRRIGVRGFPSFVALRDEVLRGMCEVF